MCVYGYTKTTVEQNGRNCACLRHPGKGVLSTFGSVKVASLKIHRTNRVEFVMGNGKNSEMTEKRLLLALRSVTWSIISRVWADVSVWVLYAFQKHAMGTFSANVYEMTNGQIQWRADIEMVMESFVPVHLIPDVGKCLQTIFGNGTEFKKEQHMLNNCKGRFEIMF